MLVYISPSDRVGIIVKRIILFKGDSCVGTQERFQFLLALLVGDYPRARRRIVPAQVIPGSLCRQVDVLGNLPKVVLQIVNIVLHLEEVDNLGNIQDLGRAHLDLSGDFFSSEDAQHCKRV